jgi:hypothetical protein
MVEQKLDKEMGILDDSNMGSSPGAYLKRSRSFSKSQTPQFGDKEGGIDKFKLHDDVNEG